MMFSTPVEIDRDKSAASQCLPPGHPGREALLVQPDRLEVETFDAIISTRVRLLRTNTEEANDSFRRLPGYGGR